MQCNDTPAHCGAGCQAAFGRCGLTTTTSSPKASPTPSAIPDVRCGSGGNGVQCPNNLCCSFASWCGNTDAHCGTGCQSPFGRCNSQTTSASPTRSPTPSPTPSTIPDVRCGSGGNGVQCPNNLCCSFASWCGNTDAHCGTGCQSPFGRCNSQTTSASPTRSPVSPTPSQASPTPSPTLIISPDGTCGINEDGKNTGYRCGGTDCCSQYGYCGASDDYCLASAGCQKGFGRCGPLVASSSQSSPTPSPVSPTPSPISPTPSQASPTLSPISPTPSPISPTPSPISPTPSPISPTPSQASPTPSPVSPTPSPVSPTPSQASPTPSPVSPTPSKASSSSASPTPSPTLPLSPDGTCGNNNGKNTGFRCDVGQCCSQYGYCGTTSEYCAIPGCQAGFGLCGVLPTSSSSVRITTTSASKTTSAAPSPTSTVTISPDGTCGITDVGKNTGYTCPSGQCCSQYGYCGTTSDYCNAKSQCAFGVCSGTSTTTAASPSPAPTNFPQPDPSKAAPYIEACKRSGTFALTFDDGPSSYVPRLLDILKANGVKATFFINGRNFADLTQADSQDRLRRAFNEGHQIASHTLTHADLATLSNAAMWQEMADNDALIKAVIGKRPVYMRPPYGSYNDNVLAAMGTWGYKVIGWNVDSKDYEHTGQPNFMQLNEDNYNSDLAAIGAKFPTTPLMTLQHDHVPEDSTPDGWAQHVITEFKARGYTFVTVGECLNDSPANWYRN
ncbi:hypothetical protein HK105_205118 [Polyrhizophydium stewartii]|uniref:Chitooligosaccharide deacetylase n=1 Tax=Polyrhizophydium stewartii TaxID=2732419 RepID=A0ABR4N701_9FUNG